MYLKINMKPHLIKMSHIFKMYKIAIKKIYEMMKKGLVELKKTEAKRQKLYIV